MRGRTARAARRCAGRSPRPAGGSDVRPAAGSRDRSGSRRPRRSVRPSPIDMRVAIGSAVTSRPSTSARPRSGRSSVVRMRTAVVLPAPFGPSSPSTVPVRHRERDALECLDVAERLDEIFREDGRGAHGGRCYGGGDSSPSSFAAGVVGAPHDRDRALRMVGIEHDLEVTERTRRCLVDDRDLFLLGPTLHDVAQAEQPGGNDAARGRAPEPVDRSDERLVVGRRSSLVSGSSGSPVVRTASSSIPAG